MKFFRTATGAKATYNVLSFRQHPWFIRNGNRRGRRLEVAEDRKTNSVLFLRTAALAIAAAYLFFGSRIASAGLEGLQRMEIACYKAQVVLVQERQEETVPHFRNSDWPGWLPFILRPTFRGRKSGRECAALQRSDRIL